MAKEIKLGQVIDDGEPPLTHDEWTENQEKLAAAEEAERASKPGKKVAPAAPPKPTIGAGAVPAKK